MTTTAKTTKAKTTKARTATTTAWTTTKINPTTINKKSAATATTTKINSTTINKKSAAAAAAAAAATTTKINSTTINKNTFQKKEGFLKAFDVDQKIKDNILELTKDWASKLFKYDPRHEQGLRKLIIIKGMIDVGLINQTDFDDLMKNLQVITDVITRDVDIPGFGGLGGCAHRDAGIIIAPKASRRTHEWTHGVIHRDDDMNKHGGVLAAEFVLDTITKENGSIRFWPTSLFAPCEPKHNDRYVKHLSCRELTAKKGSVKVWDARMLHQSLPNKGNKSTVKLLWHIVSKSWQKKHGDRTKNK